ncbi:biopolymer transporter ExbD [bacterium]|nr:biopolymer transporter ExbD [FCB group bacterium]MBL7191382.1 biopolymer transporter ExbD [bacterium]
MFTDKKKKKGESQIPTASLPDIVFLLLIFFLVTTTIDLDKGIDLTLPEKGGEVKVRSENISNVLINATGQILIDEEPVEVPSIREVVEDKIQARGFGADGKPILIVSIKTDRETDYNTYIEVLDQIKLAGATKISIAEPEGKR